MTRRKTAGYAVDVLNGTWQKRIDTYASLLPEKWTIAQSANFVVYLLNDHASRVKNNKERGMSQILPDGVTVADLENFDLSKTAITPQNAEVASIMADLVIKKHTEDRREGWIWQARIAEFVKRHELWRYHPGNFSSITEWARQPEIDIESGLLSEMIAIVEMEPEFAAAGYDLFQLIRDVGGSKVRKLVPTMREAKRAGILTEQVGPMLDELRGTDMNGIIDMLNPKGGRVGFDPEVVYEEELDGTFTISFPGLDLDQLEFVAKKLKLRKWTDPTGRQIEPPILPATV